MCEKKARLLETSIDSLVPSISSFLSPPPLRPQNPVPSTSSSSASPCFLSELRNRSGVFVVFVICLAVSASLTQFNNVPERGNQRDRDRERAQARSGGNKTKPKNDGLTPEQRRERDAKALQEKAKKKAAAEQAGGINAGGKK